MDNITTSMGLEYEVKVPEDNQWGYRSPNGTWTGMLGDLERNESDLAVGPFVLTHATAETFPHGDIYILNDFLILAGIKHPFVTQVFTTVSAFDLQMWLLVILFLLVLSAVSMALVEVSPQTQSSRMTTNQWEIYAELLLTFFAGAMQEAHPLRGVPSRSVHCLFLLWMTSCIFLMNFFTANLSASLMVKTEAPRIRKVADVLKTPNKRILLFANSGFQDLLLYTDVESYRHVYEQVQRTRGEMPPELVFTDQHFTDVIEERAIILQEWLTFRDQVARNCPRLKGRGFMYLSEESLTSLAIGWYIRPGFDPLLHREFNIRLRWITESGLADKFLEDVSPGGGDCWLRHSDKGDMEHRILDFSDLRPIFVLHVVLSSGAILALVVELYKTNRGSR
ncbi:probable glutamate receptor [Ornithodoros turicata]|uniref:probable glutamate receptor n=1 Tax=Ornithodoros turicata TaxID=34597 RepID=UPI0031388761